MIIDLKAMQLEDMAETAREIVEEGKDDDPSDYDFNNNSKELGAQRLKKLRIKSTMPHDKKYQVAKVRAFKQAISEFGK